MGRASRVGTVVGAVLVIAFGLFSNHWWSIDLGGLARGLGGGLGDVASGSVGLRGREACIAGICQVTSFSRVGGGGITGMLVQLTYWGGLVVLGALVAGTAMRELRGESRLARMAGTGCLVLMMSSIATIVAGMAVVSPFGSLVPSYAGFVVVVGCLAGAYAARSESSGWEGSGAAPVLPRLPPQEVAPSSPARQLASQLDAQTRTASRVTPQLSAKAAMRQGASTVGDASIDAIRTTLRFVATSIEIGEDRLVASVDGNRLEVAFAEISQIIARRLPADPPFDGTVLVDLVTATRPIRLLPSTAGNYNALPGPSSVRAIDNLRRLGAAIGAKRPEIIEPRSAPFFLQGRLPETFTAIKQFAAYDATYTR